MSPASKRRTRRRTPLSRTRVLQAAVELADRDGLGSLSMRKLGGELGVEAMSLYNHVANKDDLLDGIVDVVTAEFEDPRAIDGDDWRDVVRRCVMTDARCAAAASMDSGPGRIARGHRTSAPAVLRLAAGGPA